MDQADTSESPISLQPTPRSGPSFISSSLDNPTAVPSPSIAAIPLLKLVSPAEDTSLVAGDTITFTWDWDTATEEGAGRFVFELQAGADVQPVLREELPLPQRQYVISRSLEPGRYLWTMSVTGIAGGEISAGRLFVLTEPTATPAVSTATPAGSSN
jgi:hypothetical protein